MRTAFFRPAGLPAAMLITFLQRTPVVQLATEVEETLASAPAPAILRSAFAAAASLGAIHSLAGATTIVASPKSPLNATVGVAISGVAFIVSGTQAPASSWRITAGTVAPGLNLSGLTGIGAINVTTSDGHALLSGTPTAAGTYQFTTVAYQNPNGVGASSPAASYTVIVSANANAPNFTTQPQAQTVNVGQPATFTAAASGSPAYQWKKDGVAVAGATGATLTLASAQLSDAGTYTVVATNSSGSTTSASATLTVLNPLAPPVFSVQPYDQSVTAGTNLTFSVAASGSPAYRWLKNGVALSDGGGISGSATAALTIASSQVSDSGTYTAVATNASGSTASSPAVLTVTVATVAPFFSILPTGQTVASGTTVSFAAQAGGNPAPSYQWQKDGVSLVNSSTVSGANSPTLVIFGATAANAGTYACVAANSAGSVTSLGAGLQVTSTANPGRLINLSVNTFVQGTLTMGFVIGGPGTSGSENVLIRGIGPALGAFGEGSLLPDPALTVIQQSTGSAVAANAGWAATTTNQAQVTAADAATGAFPLTSTSSKDSALVAPLAISLGGYTVQVAGKSGDSGNALCEVYDNTSPSSYTAASARLVNVSCNTFVAAGGALTAGFVIGGTTAKTVLVRAAGPTLKASFGVAGAMADPQIVVQAQNSSGALASNAGWGGSPQLTAVGSAVGAFAFSSATSADSAVVLTLAPGAYTAQVSSAGGGSGIVIVEVYEVP